MAGPALNPRIGIRHGRASTGNLDGGTRPKPRREAASTALDDDETPGWKEAGGRLPLP